MQYYTAVTVMTIIIMAISSAITLENYILPKNKRICRIICFIFIAASALFEWSGTMLDGASQARTLHIGVKLTEFFIAPIIPVLFAESVSAVKQRHSVICKYAVYEIFELTTVFHGLLFSVDKNNIYHRGPFYFIYILILIYGATISSKVLAQFMENFQYHRRYIVIFVSAFVILGGINQIIFPEIKTIWICVAVSFLLITLYCTELRQKIDALTQLLNRSTYESNVFSISKRAKIIYLDIDKFKEINDTYGHDAGDKALKAVAAIIWDTYGKYGKCYRIGGDEFCVVITKQFVDIDFTNRKFHEAVKDRRSLDSKMPDVSIGYAEFDPRTDSFADVVKAADAMMYNNKRRSSR